MRYQIYERGLLQSVKGAMGYGAYDSADDMAEAKRILQDILDFGVDAFIYDSETGTVIDYWSLA